MADNNGFISEISFKEDFPPFKNKDKIIFGGEKQVQNLIEFYSGDKKNAERFKINFIVGENGVGKSRLFEKIIKDYGKNYEIILDDFSPFTSLSFLAENINKDLFATIEKKGKVQGFNNYTNGFIFIYSLLYKDLDFISLFKKNFSLSYKFEGKGESKDLSRFFRYDFIEGLSFQKRFGTYDGKHGYKKHIISTAEIYKALLYLKESKNSEHIDNYMITLIEEIIINILNSTFRNKRIFEDPGISCEIPKYDKLYISDEMQKILSSYRNNEDKESDLIKSILYLLELLDVGIKHKILFLEFLGNKVLYTINMFFKENGTKYELINLSGGERSILLRITNLFTTILKVSGKQKTNNKPFIVLIDEPDLHLHLDWQRKYMEKLIDVFSNLDKSIKIHFIIATHSPFILSDLPKESILLLEKGEKYTEIKEYKEKTFGANFVDLIKNGFFFREHQILMGSFAEEVIKKLSKAYGFLIIGIEKIDKDKLSKDEKDILTWIENKKIDLPTFQENYIEQIGDDFIKNNLLLL